ncbi:protein sprouty homolog 3 [Alosa sapidissima]|uniref:protein sprouty homolog 3 n=1 Tax=Alosa sapidissima TaxID=34773 RepID=UPI001C0809DA|nr:protein sprouty homolog 3 [Alosa sapidissima]
MDPALLRMDGTDDIQQVLSIDQIRCIRANNDYVERPVALELASQSGIFYAHDDRHHQHLHHHRHHPHPVQPLSSSAPPPAQIPRSQSGQQQQQQPPLHRAHLSRSSTVSSSMSRGSAASDTRLLAGLTPSHSSGLASVSGSMAVVSTQPKGDQGIKKASEALGKGGGLSGEDHLGLHLFICERCGRCKCGECVAPRVLPSCWACGQRCLCSAESAVEYGTCLCCVKGLFYHCSAEDDEDNCADRPCACTPARACARWGTMALLVPFLPCLCCYPPAKLCLALCQRGYDRATRPGCRCRNTNTVCRKISSAAAAATNQPPSFQKSLEKPV